MSKAKELPNVRLGQLFTIKYGYVGGPLLEMKEHILIQALRSEYHQLKDLEPFINRLRNVAIAEPKPNATLSNLEGR